MVRCSRKEQNPASVMSVWNSHRRPEMWALRESEKESAGVTCLTFPAR